MSWRQFTSVRIALLLGLLLAALRFENPDFLQALDARALDYRLRLRGPIQPAGQVVIVAIDDQSLAQVGRWVWPRTILAQLFERIDAAEPRVITLDIVFSETSIFQEQPELSARPASVSPQAWEMAQQTLQAQDDALAELIKKSGRIVLGYFLDFQKGAVPASPKYLSTYNLVSGSAGGKGESKLEYARGANTNLEAFEEAARATGFFNVMPDADGPVRRIPLVLAYKDQMMLPLALSTLKVAAGKVPLRLKFDDAGVKDLSFGPVSIPVDNEGKMLLNYRGPTKTFPHISAVDILRGHVPPETFRDKIVLVGVTATAVFDVRVTPFEEVFPGIEIHANVIDNILQGDFIRQPLLLVVVEMGVILAVTMLLGLAMMRARGVAGALTAVALLSGYIVGSQVLFVTLGWPLSVFYPLIAVSLTYASIALHHYVTEERERKKMRSALDLYLSPKTAELVSRDPEKLEPDQRDLTVFFSDIRGFTTLTEKLDPEVLSNVLNEYLGGMTDIVFDHDGMLDKYIGDAVMAVWGAPLDQPDHARRACLATLDMVELLPELNQSWQKQGFIKEPMQIGCGLNTGPMKFGNYGSKQHLAITVIGDNVNLGSRLEGLTKTYHVDIIVSEATMLAADGAVVFRELDQVKVKGKLEAVRICQLLGRYEHRDRWSDLIEGFAKGLKAYRERRWEDALSIFSAIVEKYPEDGPSQMFIDRCRILLASPPGPEWDAVVTMESK
jgi:adenylate cyclase